MWANVWANAWLWCGHSGFGGSSPRRASFLCSSPHYCARGPANAHVGPMTCVWAAPPTRIFSGLRAIYTPAMRRCVQQAGRLFRNTLLPTFSSRCSAMWAPHHPEPRPHCPEPWPHCSEPRPRRDPTGGFAPSKAPTRRRHTARGVRMAQTPPPLPLVSGSLTDAMPFTGAGLPGGVPINVGGASPRMMGASRSPAPRVCLLLMRCIPSEELVRAR